MGGLRWSLLLVSAWFTALFIAWQLLSTVNFLYPLWHNALNIGDTVRVYGPQNRYRHGFEQTTAQEQARLFAAILDAVENDGRGLNDLRYRDPEGKPIDRLLTPPEIVHLKDVTRLIAGFYKFSWACLIVFIAVIISLWMRPTARPALKRVLVTFSTVITAGTVLVLVLGAKKVFYKLHTWIFPEGHRWFFYYQESLMTTLMKAPDLFAGIAVEWLVLTLMLYGLIVALTLKLIPTPKKCTAPAA